MLTFVFSVLVHELFPLASYAKHWAFECAWEPSIERTAQLVQFAVPPSFVGIRVTIMCKHACWNRFVSSTTSSVDAMNAHWMRFRFASINSVCKPVRIQFRCGHTLTDHRSLHLWLYIRSVFCHKLNARSTATSWTSYSQPQQPQM